MIEWLKELSDNSAFVAGVFTILGGILLKLTDKWLKGHSDIISDRKDYREEIAELRERLDKLEEDLAKWRSTAHHLEEELTKARVQIVNLGGEVEPRTLPFT